MVICCERLPHKLDAIFLMGLNSTSNVTIDVDEFVFIFFADIDDDLGGICSQGTESVSLLPGKGQRLKLRTFIVNAHSSECNHCTLRALI